MNRRNTRRTLAAIGVGLGLIAMAAAAKSQTGEILWSLETKG